MRCVILLLTIGGLASLEVDNDIATMLLERLAKIEGTLAHLIERIEDIETKHAEQNTTVDVDPSEVAFYAFLQSEQRNLPVGHTIKYDGVGNNYGDGYDPITGVFTCPTAGLYLFTIFIDPTNDAQAAVSLKKDGVGYTQAIAEPSFNGQDLTGGSARPFRLAKGDRVWVEVINFETSLWESYTTFSGLLIHR